MKNKILILLSMLILMIGLSSIVSAGSPTCSVNVPASNTAYTGTIDVNITITSNGTGDYNITGFNMSTPADAGFVDCRGTINASSYQCSVDTASVITEIRQTTVTANIIVNDTNSGIVNNGSCTSTLVDFDNTNPVCSSITPNFIILEVLNPLEATCIATDTTDLTLDITLCTADSQTCTTETKSSSAVKTFTATFEGSETLNLGEATISCIATDEVNKQTACTNQTITIKGDGALVEDIIITGEEVTEGINIGMMVGIIIGIVALLIIVLFVVLKPKKKRG